MKDSSTFSSFAGLVWNSLLGNPSNAPVQLATVQHQRAGKHLFLALYASYATPRSLSRDCAALSWQSCGEALDASIRLRSGRVTISHMSVVLAPHIEALALYPVQRSTEMQSMRFNERSFSK